MRRDYQRDLPQTNWESAVVDTLLEPQNLSNWEAVSVAAKRLAGVLCIASWKH